jgi:hypothetical protein
MIPFVELFGRKIMFRKLLLAFSRIFLLTGCSKNQKVKIETTKGDITVELFSDIPVTTKNFSDLVSSGFFNGLNFHRYVPGFVIQGEILPEQGRAVRVKPFLWKLQAINMLLVPSE